MVLYFVQRDIHVQKMYKEVYDVMKLQKDTQKTKTVLPEKEGVNRMRPENKGRVGVNRNYMLFIFSIMNSMNILLKILIDQ